MKRVTQIGILLLIVIMTFSSFTHPLKVTSSLINYNTDTQKIKVECRVFVDDFLLSLGRDMNCHKLTNKDKSAIENYFNKYFIMELNNKKLPFKIETSDYNENFNVLNIQFLENDATIKKGDILKVSNQLLFDEFEFVQSNRMELRFKPFFKVAYFESTKIQDSFSHTF